MQNKIPKTLNGPGTMIILAYIAGRTALRALIARVELHDIGGMHQIRLWMKDGKVLIHGAMVEDEEVYQYLHNLIA